MSTHANPQVFPKLASIAVDLDGTLARHDADKPFDPKHIGTPVPKMMEKVKRYLEQGKEVKIFTARASDPKNVKPIQKWLSRVGLGKLPITHEKTPDIEKIYDDRAVGVHKNKGTIKSGSYIDGGGIHFGNGAPFDRVSNAIAKYLLYPANRLLGNQSFITAHGGSDLGVNMFGTRSWLPSVFNAKWLPASLGTWRVGELGKQMKEEGARQTKTLLSLACNAGGGCTPKTYERLLGHPLERVVMNPDKSSTLTSVSPAMTAWLKLIAPKDVASRIGPLHTFTKQEGEWVDQGPYRRFDVLAGTVLGGLGITSYMAAKKKKEQEAAAALALTPKMAELEGVQLKPHQKRLVEKMLDPRTKGLLAQHGLGSGKTLSSIATWDALGRPNTAVVVPAALQENYRKELQKWVGNVPANVNIMSQQRLARQPEWEGPAPDLMIVDEQHKAREQSSALRQALANVPAKKRLLLTGTPIYNHPQDIASTVNIAAGKTILPTNRADFNDRYIKTEKVNPPILQRLMGVKPGVRQVLQNKEELRRILKQYVDYHPNSAAGFPRSTEQTVKVPMGPKQVELYNAIMGKAPWWVRWKVKAGMPPGKGELESMRAFLTGARQVSNTNREFVKRPNMEQATKINKAFDFFRKQVSADPSYKGVVYSNYINSGLAPYKDLLTRANIPYGEFSGSMGRKERDEMVKQYNANKLKALLISSAGAEGLDLKGTRLIQLLEPHFNEEKEKQIIGRGIRYGSHAGLSPEQQHVLVQRYLAEPQGNWLDRLLGKQTTGGTDEYIRNLAVQKSLLNNQVAQLLKNE